MSQEETHHITYLLKKTTYQDLIDEHSSRGTQTCSLLKLAAVAFELYWCTISCRRVFWNPNNWRNHKIIVVVVDKRLADRAHWPVKANSVLTSLLRQNIEAEGWNTSDAGIPADDIEYFLTLWQIQESLQYFWVSSMVSALGKTSPMFISLLLVCSRQYWCHTNGACVGGT